MSTAMPITSDSQVDAAHTETPADQSNIDDVVQHATQTISRLSDGIKTFRETEGLLEELETRIETLRGLSDARDEVKRLEGEVNRLEQESDELSEGVFAVQREMRDRSGVIADAIQSILDSTRDDKLFRLRIEGLRDALRREANQPLDGRQGELHASTLVGFAYQYAPRVA